jgi:hypothetical protein
VQQRVEFRKHGLLVLGFDNQSGDGQKDAAQGEEKGQGLGMKQAGYYCSPNSHQESANNDRPVLEKYTGDALSKTQQQDYDQEKVHWHPEYGNHAYGQGENSEQSPDVPYRLPYLVGRGVLVFFIDYIGKRIADGRESKPQEIPGGAARIMPQQVYGQRENCEEYPPEDESLGVVSEDGLTAVVESFCNEGKAFASGHFFVLFHNKN